MPKIKYVDRNFSAASLATIEKANEIITEYQAQGFVLTLRQLYYQFVSRALIANKVSEYKRLGSVINDARLAGLIDWSAIEDRTRNLQTLPSWSSPANIIDSAAYSFRHDLWKDQDYRIEVWIEKEALAGVFQGVCQELRVPFFCCRGYVSQSEAWGAAQRLKQWSRGGQKTIILHFGDHDPSGIDMTRDIADRMEVFGVDLEEMKRLALNFDQVEQYNPPANPAKETDSRFQSYMVKYGDESWELDALEPQVLADLVRNAVDDFRDADQWEESMEEETGEKKLLQLTSDKWASVETFLSEEKE